MKRVGLRGNLENPVWDTVQCEKLEGHMDEIAVRLEM